MTQTPTRKLISNIGHLVTMDAARSILSDAWIVVEDGNVKGVGSGAPPEGPFTEQIDAYGGIATPGLINTHHHFYQTMARANTPGNSAPLLPWLAAMNKLWKGFNNDDLYLVSRLALAEMMLTGCTTAADHHYIVPDGTTDHHDAQFAAADSLGVRFHCARGAMDKPSDLNPPDVCQSTDAILADTERLLSTYHDTSHGAMRQVFLAPCAATSCTEQLLRDAATLARTHNIPLHTHCGETVAENAYSLEHFGQRPIEYLANLGWDFEGVYFAHGIHFTDEEVAFLGKNKMGVAHCPYANMRLGSGVCRVGDLRAAGASVGIGVDGSGSNDSGHLLGELRQALMLARVRYGPEAMTPMQALEIGTLEGAKILNNRTDIGAITPGMCADLAIFPAVDIFSSGHENPVDALILCWPRSVDTLVIGGEVKIRDGSFVNLDLDSLIAQHHSRAKEFHANGR